MKIILEDDTTIRVEYKEIEEMFNSKPTRGVNLINLVNDIIKINGGDANENKSFNDLAIKKIDFDSYTELVYASELDKKLVSGDILVTVGTTIENKVCEVSVDSITNTLVNISRYQEMKTHGTQEYKAIKTFCFNANLNSIADFFDIHATYALNSNVRESIRTQQLNNDNSEMKKTFESYQDNFYLYNNGITIITNKDLEIDEVQNLIKIERPEIINGAQTLGKYLCFKVLNTEKVDCIKTIEIPLRVMIVNCLDIELESISTDISAKINTQKPVVHDELLFANLKRMDILGEGGLNIAKDRHAMREYQKLYVSAILESPGKAKNKMKKVIETSVLEEPLNQNDECDKVLLSELNKKINIFIPGNIQIEIDNDMDYFLKLDNSNNYDGQVISSKELHNAVQKTLAPLKRTIEDRMGDKEINSKYDQYIISSFFNFLKYRVNESNLKKIDSVAVTEIFELSSRLVTEYTDMVAKTVLTIYKKIIGEQYIDRIRSSVPSNTSDATKRYLAKLGNHEKEEQNEISRGELRQLLSYQVSWDIIIKYQKYKPLNMTKSIDEFSDFYQYSAFTFKSDYLFDFYKELIPELYKEYQDNDKKLSKERVQEVMTTLLSHPKN